MGYTSTNTAFEPTNMVIQITKDYSLFKKIEVNRNIDMNHIARLIESMSRCYLICPLVINEHFEIIDGQHRFTAAQNLGLPIYFFLVKGYGVEEIKMLNALAKTWSKKNFLEHFVKRGFEPYVQMDKFMHSFPDFSLSVAERILRRRQYIPAKTFQQGEMVIPDLKWSYDVAGKLMEIKPFYKKISRGTFVDAMTTTFQTNGYEHRWFMKQLEKSYSQLEDFKTKTAYLQVIENIYNDNCKAAARISLF